MYNVCHHKRTAMAPNNPKHKQQQLVLRLGSGGTQVDRFRQTSRQAGRQAHTRKTNRTHNSKAKQERYVTIRERLWLLVCPGCYCDTVCYDLARASKSQAGVAAHNGSALYGSPCRRL